MTMAVCFKCGVIKFGAYVPCPECAAAPQTEDDLALSLAMSDHFFDMPTLEQMGAAVRDGKPPHLDPQTHAHLIEGMRRARMHPKLQELFSDLGIEIPGSEERPPPEPPNDGPGA